MPISVHPKVDSYWQCHKTVAYLTMANSQQHTCPSTPEHRQTSMLHPPLRSVLAQQPWRLLHNPFPSSLITLSHHWNKINCTWRSQLWRMRLGCFLNPPHHICQFANNSQHALDKAWLFPWGPGSSTKFVSMNLEAIAAALGIQRRRVEQFIEYACPFFSVCSHI